PLNLVAGVVERRNTLPVLANVLLQLDGDRLSLTGTDLEVELVGRVQLPTPGDAGEVTLPARKLLDICKSLPEGSDVQVSVTDSKATVTSGRSRFTLATLPAREFPNIEDSIGTHQFTIEPQQLRRLIERTSFAMAQQDVRYYLNGMLWEIKGGRLRFVATDGHRLAICTLPEALSGVDDAQVILPRKGVLELGRLLQDDDDAVTVILGNNHLRATTAGFTFTSKLVDGK
ncbi:MAG TPA: DNA polymerase III subunit beta, partial [Halieaceae bacterium]|nr:DNA polymerase III subunit beta [Halieaceae bacterium]